MADFGSPVAQNVNPNAGIQTLQSILGIKQAQQNLQTGAIQQQRAQAAATVDTQTAKENQALASLLHDPVAAGIVDKDGNPTAAGESIILKTAPTTGAESFGKIVNAARSKVDFNNSVNTLNQNERAEIGSTLAGAAAGGDLNAVQTAAQQLLDSKAGTATYDDYKRILDTTMQVVTKQAQISPKAGLQAALGMGREVIGANAVVGAGGIAAPQTGTMDTGGQIQPGTVAPALQGGGFTPSGPPINKTPAPSVTTLPSGSLGTVGGVYGVPQPAPPPPQSKLQPLARPPANAPAADQANYANRIKSEGTEQQAVSNAANDPLNGVQSTRFRNQQILDLIPHADTGPGLKMLNTIASRLPGATGDAYQDIEHYTAQNSAALAKLMGVPGTNLGHETAAAAAGSVEKNPGALAEITKTNDALNTAFDLYNRGLAKATKNGSDPSLAPAYKQAFGQNLDINAIRWADAHRRKDSEEIAKLQQKGDVSEWTKKLQVLKSLASTGDLP